MARCYFFVGSGRCERIRTSDPFLPKEVRYQTALHTVSQESLKATRIILVVSSCFKIIDRAVACGVGTISKG